MMREEKVRVYRGVNIHPDTSQNGMGLRYWAFGAHGTRLRSSTLAGMRELIREDLNPKGSHYEWDTSRPGYTGCTS
jgi:hypothetical protein